MFNKILVVFSLFFLFSCSFGGETKDSDLVKKLHRKIDRKDFSMLVPRTWTILKPNEGNFPRPSYGNLAVSIVSKKPVNGIYRNILILKQEIKKVTSLEFIVGNYLASKNNFYYFKKLGEKDVNIDGKKTKIYTFKARYSEDSSLLKYITTGIVCNDKEGFLITITLEYANNSLEKYENLLGTFKCKK